MKTNNNSLLAPYFSPPFWVSSSGWTYEARRCIKTPNEQLYNATENCRFIPTLVIFVFVQYRGAALYFRSAFPHEKLATLMQNYVALRIYEIRKLCLALSSRNLMAKCKSHDDGDMSAYDSPRGEWSVVETTSTASTEKCQEVNFAAFRGSECGDHHRTTVVDSFFGRGNEEMSIPSAAIYYHRCAFPTALKSRLTLHVEVMQIYHSFFLIAHLTPFQRTSSEAVSAAAIKNCWWKNDEHFTFALALLKSNNV